MPILKYSLHKGVARLCNPNAAKQFHFFFFYNIRYYDLKYMTSILSSIFRQHGRSFYILDRGEIPNNF